MSGRIHCRKCCQILVWIVFIFLKDIRSDPQSMWEQLGGVKQGAIQLDEVNPDSKVNQDYDQEAELFTEDFQPLINSSFERLTLEKLPNSNSFKKDIESHGQANRRNDDDGDDEVEFVDDEGGNEGRVSAVKVLSEVIFDMYILKPHKFCNFMLTIL